MLLLENLMIKFFCQHVLIACQLREQTMYLLTLVLEV